MLQLIDESSELSLLDRRVTAFGVGVEAFRRNIMDELEKSTELATASELRRAAVLEGDLPLVKVNRRLSFWPFACELSSPLASSGLPELE